MRTKRSIILSNYNDELAKDTIRRITEAAIQLFATQGYKGTTTRDIVREAGSSLSSLQVHFQSKENVYLAAINQTLERQEALLLPIFQDIETAKQQEKLFGETAWNFIIRLTEQITEWVFLPQERYAILLITREMMNPVFFASMPDRAMKIHMQYLNLFKAYASHAPEDKLKLLSYSIVLSIFDYAAYPSVLNQILKKDVLETDAKTELKENMLSYLLFSTRTYLDSFQ